MRSNKTLASLAAAILFAAAGITASAHEGHHHPDKGPHGGQLVMTGAYHYEMVVRPGEIDLYVLDGKLQALPLHGMEGTLQIQSADKAVQNVKLSPAEGHFKAAADVGPAKSFIAVATLKIGGQETVGRFRHAAGGQKE